MSNFVFVLDTNKQPLSPVHPGQARRLLSLGKAAVYKRFPFTVILKQAVEQNPPSKGVTLKIDPGSKTTGIALIQENKVIWGAELTHRAYEISRSLYKRAGVRRSRRRRKTRYRRCKGIERNKPKGWLAPSMMHRILTTLTWVKRLQRFAPVTALSVELAKFDTQKMQNPEISGMEYQEGELAGYELREYLLEKWGRKCTYCGAQGVRLQIDHIHPRSRVGSNRVSNLCLACVPCNLAKGNQGIEEFLAGKRKLLNRIKAEVKTPLKDAAAINTTRSALLKALEETGKPVETGTGGQTKYNRSRLGLPKAHWLDAACVGTVDELKICTSQPLLITCKGHGKRQMTNVSKNGFPRTSAKKKPWGGWKTGDLVKLVKPNGQKIVGRLKVGAKPSRFEIRINKERIFRNPKRNQLICIQKRDGYDYSF